MICFPVSRGRPSLPRVRTQIHASCAARDEDGVLLLGAPGCGKSDLTLRLIDRGFVLVSDDRVEIEAGRAFPPAGLEGLIEMRGLGILRLAHRASARLVLACELAEPSLHHPISRLPTPAAHAFGMPLLRLDARAASAPLMIAHALDCLQGRAAMHTGAFA